MLWRPLFGHIVEVESLCRCQIVSDFLEISFVAKLVQKLCYILMGQTPTCEALLYTKSNLPVLALTTSKDFKIGPSTTEIRGVSKSSLTLNNPVGLLKRYINEKLNYSCRERGWFSVLMGTLFCEEMSSTHGLRDSYFLGRFVNQCLLLNGILLHYLCIL